MPSRGLSAPGARPRCSNVDDCVAFTLHVVTADVASRRWHGSALQPASHASFGDWARRTRFRKLALRGTPDLRPLAHREPERHGASSRGRVRVEVRQEGLGRANEVRAKGSWTPKDGIRPSGTDARRGAQRCCPRVCPRPSAEDKLIQDRIGGTPVIVVVGPDDKSVRVFEARIDGQHATPEFYRNGGLTIDSLTGSKWSFQGCAIEGPATGQCLTSIQAIKDYRFDWKLYHPATTVHNR